MRCKHSPILAGSIFVCADFSQSVELEQRFKMLLRCDAGVVGRLAFLGSVDAEQSEPSPRLNPEAEINAAVDGIAVDDSRVCRSIAVLERWCFHADDIAVGGSLLFTAELAGSDVTACPVRSGRRRVYDFASVKHFPKETDELNHEIIKIR